MKKIVFIILAFIPGMIYATTTKITLSEAIKNNTVTADGINFDGGYCGKTTKLTITNNTKSVIQLTVDLGVVLKPDNDAYQPMVLAGEEFVMIMPNSIGEVIVQTFCGNAPRSCPGTNSHYTFGYKGSDTLVKILRFIKQYSIFNYLGQHAVWAYTNHHDIEDVYSYDKEALSRQLQEFLATTLGRPKPVYSREVAVSQAPEQPAYVPKTMKIVANFEIILDSPKVLTLGIYNDSGVMVQKVFENQEFGKSGHRFGVEYEAEGALQGKYFIRLKEGEKILREQMVKVD